MSGNAQHSQSDDDDDNEEEEEMAVSVAEQRRRQHQQKIVGKKKTAPTIHTVTPKRSRKSIANNATVTNISLMSLDEDDTMGDESKEASTIIQTPPCSPIKSLNNSASPVGVNRRYVLHNLFSIMCLEYKMF